MIKDALSIQGDTPPFGKGPVVLDEVDLFRFASPDIYTDLRFRLNTGNRLREQIQRQKPFCTE